MTCISSTDKINTSSCTGHINNYVLRVLINGLTISERRCHRSESYATLYRMVCININNDVVSFHSRAVIDQPHYRPCKMKLKIRLLSPFSQQCRLVKLHFKLHYQMTLKYTWTGRANGRCKINLPASNKYLQNVSFIT